MQKEKGGLRKKTRYERLEGDRNEKEGASTSGHLRQGTHSLPREM